MMRKFALMRGSLSTVRARYLLLSANDDMSLR